MKDTSLPSHQELEKLRAQVAYIHELEEREKQLTTELADNHEAIWQLRQNPAYLEATAWERLEEVTNKIYKGYTQRLKAEFTLLTELDIQLCILLKLQFNISQIASITAVSTSSVSVQKNRLKKRLLQVNEHLFDDNNKTLDTFLLEY